MNYENCCNFRHIRITPHMKLITCQRYMNYREFDTCFDNGDMAENEISNRNNQGYLKRKGFM